MSDYPVLLLSIVLLFVGPLLYLWLSKGGLFAKAFDSAIVVVLIAMMAFLLIPESWAMLGYWSIVLIFVGYMLPGLLERLIQKAAHTLHLISLILALMGLAVHAMLDGAALLIAEGDSGSQLGFAVVIHRFGTGLMLWMMVQPVFGKRIAFGVLGFVALATVVGFLLSGVLLELQGDAAIAVLQALVIGMILHSLIHRGHGIAVH